MNVLESMLSDSIKELIAMLRDASEEARNGEEFSMGRKMGLLAAVSLIQDQARTFGIPLRSLSLPEEDILEVILKEYK